MMKRIYMGDVVRLKLGGPDMTVAGVLDKGRVVSCIWLEGDDIRRLAFNASDLERVVL